MTLDDYQFGMAKSPIAPQAEQPGSQKPVEHFLRQWRERAGLDQEQLADLMGVEQATVSRWENGERGFTQKRAREAAAHLGCTAEDILFRTPPNTPEPPSARGLFDSVPANEITVRPKLREPKDKLRVLGRGHGGKDDEFDIDNDQIVGYIDCPPSLEANRDAYGVYIHGESMLPRYEPGDAVSVNPDRPTRPGDYVVLQIRKGEHGGTSGLIKRLVRKNDREVVVEQFNPAKQLKFSRKDVISIHYILRPGE